MTPQLTNPSEMDLDLEVPMKSPEKSSVQNEDETQRSTSARKRRRLARLVSQDTLSTDFLDLSGRKTEKSSNTKSTNEASEDDNETNHSVSSSSSPQHSLLPMDLLADCNIMKIHAAAIRLEADLFPMRLILSRLMGHQTHNRKGLFNKPVDPVALGLPDYHLIVSQPMDLGTIKKKLHAISYKSRDEVAEDIRLTFRNAIRYNPPHNIVHQCAAGLLASFESSYSSLGESALSVNKKEGGTISGSVSLLQLPTALSASDEVQVGTQQSIGGFDSNISTRNHPTAAAVAPTGTQQQCFGPFASMAPPKRKSRVPPLLPHTCETCRGRKCGMCKQGCLSHEPNLVVCSGSHCGGTKIRKGAQFYITKDGHRQFCQKCFTSLPPVLPNMSDCDPCRYKQDLLKRMNDEVIPETWIDCSKCSTGVHAVCAMHCSYLGSAKDFVCSDCRCADMKDEESDTPLTMATKHSGFFTFVSGSDLPVPAASLNIGNGLSAASLPKCSISSFIENKVQEKMKIIPNADKTISVRVISSSSRYFDIPDVVRRHFRMESERDSLVTPPAKVHYIQKAITLFQKIDGLDVCIFCMYVQEYDGDDEYDACLPNDVSARHSKRVYIAYLDSVEHFRPRECRTEVYHEILVSYLASARARGFDKAQIWACPPSRGNNFVFWNHPASQRTPTQERLDAWYHGVLSRAVDCGVVTDVKSLFESDFEGPLKQLDDEAATLQEHGPSAASSGRMVCPPLLEGDFWIEEASRVHQAHISRNIKVRAPTDVCVWNVTPLSGDQLDPCPAIQVATLLKDRIMTHPSSVPFRRPVNAAALKLLNYHKIIEQPMDLGTIYSRCVLGEYHTLREIVADVELTVANAKKFNPVGHFVHKQAIEIHELFFQELDPLTKIWSASLDSCAYSWESFADMSMSLDITIEMPSQQTEEPAPTCAVIEDDRSSDCSRSFGSSMSAPSSPARSEGTDTASQDTLTPAVPKPTKKPSPKRKSSTFKTAKPPPRKLDLFVDGPDAVLHSMVGEDTWLLDKNPVAPAKSATNPKKVTKRRRSSSSPEVMFEPTVAKKRRQSWLGEEVCDSVRKMRTSFFSCSLSPNSNRMTNVETAKLQSFNDYVSEHEFTDSNTSISSPIIDARYALLEFSQYRHLEFDTLRRAKYSTSVLLFHLHNKDAPGTSPVCTSCNEAIEEVRWHKAKKTPALRRVTKGCTSGRGRKPKNPPSSNGPFVAEELCDGCHELHSKKDEFIPIPVLKQK